MIHLHNVSKYYPTKLGRKYVLKSVSASIPTDKSIAILGINGAGKSTLLRLIGGIDHPNKGYITSECHISWPLALASGLQGSMTGRENCRFVARIHGVHNTKALESYVKEFSELGDYFELPIKSYSSGMRSRLAFGLSMAFEFDIFLIDEITSVGDKRFKDKCREALDAKKANSRIIMVSHDMGTLKKNCDFGIFVKNGQLHFYSDLEEAIHVYQKQ